MGPRKLWFLRGPKSLLPKNGSLAYGEIHLFCDPPISEGEGERNKGPALFSFMGEPLLFPLSLRITFAYILSALLLLSTIKLPSASAGLRLPRPQKPRPFNLPPLRNDTVGALLVAYRNPRAVARTLRMYRAAYPEGDLVVLCDDGCYNFSALCAHFSAHWDGTPRRITTKTNPGFYLRPPQLFAYLKSLRTALPLISSRYYLYLETDSVVHHRLPPGPRYSLSGIVPVDQGWFVGAEPYYAASLNPFFVLEAWPVSPRPELGGRQVPYGGQGGSLLHTGLMHAIVQQSDDILRAEVAMFGGCSTTAGVDYVHTALVYRFNGTVGPLSGLLFLPDITGADPLLAAIVHPDKSDYDQPLGPEDAHILGSNFETALNATALGPEDEVASNPSCAATSDAITGVLGRLGAEGLAADSFARGEKWDMEEVRGQLPYYWLAA